MPISLQIGMIACWMAAGLSWVLSATAPKEVNPGYFRSTILVILGLLTAGLAFSWHDLPDWPKGLFIAAASLSFFTQAAWHLQRAVAGWRMVHALSANLFAAVVVAVVQTDAIAGMVAPSDAVGSACLLGVSLGAMLLGHYYLTAPWMSLTPLRRLVIGILIASLLRIVVAVLPIGRAAGESAMSVGSVEWGLFFVVRWLIGVGGPIVLAILVWQTLKLKHTQAATGIMYVIVLLVLLGEGAAIATR